MFKYIGILGMIFIFLIVIFFVIPAEDQFLDSLVTTGPNISLDAWREIFWNWATLGIFIALAAAVLWFVLGQWWFSMNRWMTANNKRGAWWWGLALVALMAIPGSYLTPTVQEGGRVAWFFYLANNVLVYYVATLLFSPSSFKYVPLGATSIRYW